MTSTSGTRRAVLLTGAAALAAAALTACSAGQIAETANKVPSVYHAAGENADASVLVRGLAIPYNTTKGYPAGGTAPLEVQLFNQTSRPVKVTIASAPTTEPRVVAVRTVGLSGNAPTGSPSATTAPSPASSPAGIVSPQPSPPGSPSAPVSPSTGTTPAPAASVSGAAPALQPATVTIDPLGSVSFLASGPQKVQLSGLSAALTPGTSVNLVFTFDNGAPPLNLRAPVAIPESPAARGSVQAPDAEIGQHE